MRLKFLGLLAGFKLKLFKQFIYYIITNKKGRKTPGKNLGENRELFSQV